MNLRETVENCLIFPEGTIDSSARQCLDRKAAVRVPKERFSFFYLWLKIFSVVRSGQQRSNALARVGLLRSPTSLAIILLLLFCVSGRAVTFTEDFSHDPALDGWKLYGNTNLFHWNATNKNLEVTWDSSQTNSYFYHPLTNILGKSDDFTFSFDLRLDDLEIGANPAKPYSFPLCTGFQNFTSAAKTNFFRGNGHLSPNLIEFAFFEDSGFGPTIWPSFWSTNSVLSYNNSFDYTIAGLPRGVTMRITISYTSTNQFVQTTVTTNGVPIASLNSFHLASTFTDFRTDTFAVESYSDAGQNPNDSGSLLAHGTIDNITITVPPPPVQNFSVALTNAHWQGSFNSSTNWTYVLERSSDLQTWQETSVKIIGTGGQTVLQDTNNVQTTSFYRVKSQRN